MKKVKHFLIVFFFTFSTYVYSQVNQYHSDGTRHGLWEKKYEGSDQIRYTGRFNRGVEIGEFKYYTRGFPKQPSAIKSFSDNGKKATIVYFSQKGDTISKGQLMDRKREGKWIYYHKGSRKIMLEEFYKNDQLDGIKTSYYNNGQISEITPYQAGKKNGKQQVFSSKGVLLKEFNYVNDELEGPNLFYNGKGELTIEGQYKADRKIGTWKYYQNGKVYKEKTY